MHFLEYSKERELLKKIEATESFLARNQDLISLDCLNAGTAFNIDINSFYKDDDFMRDWSDFKKEIRENPGETLNCLGLAVHQVSMKKLPAIICLKKLEKVLN